MKKLTVLFITLAGSTYQSYSAYNPIKQAIENKIAFEIKTIKQKITSFEKQVPSLWQRRAFYQQLVNDHPIVLKKTNSPYRVLSNNDSVIASFPNGTQADAYIIIHWRQEFMPIVRTLPSHS
jgi:hypothetical protein